MPRLRPVANFIVYKEQAIEQTPSGLYVPENVHRWQKRTCLDVGPLVTRIKPGESFIINPQFDTLPLGNEQTGQAIFFTHEEAVWAIVEEDPLVLVP